MVGLVAEPAHAGPPGHSIAVRVHRVGRLAQHCRWYQRQQPGTAQARREPGRQRVFARHPCPHRQNLAANRHRLHPCRWYGLRCEVLHCHRLDLLPQHGITPSPQHQRRPLARSCLPARMTLGAGPGVEQRPQRILPRRHPPWLVEQQLAAPHVRIAGGGRDGS
jgi:hypothetical protein